jgi:broad specificity phosphatase PhoE
MSRLYLVRHGETAGSEGLALGHTDLPLSPAGVRSIEALAATWSGPAPGRLIASDLARAALSAEILAPRLGVAPAFDPRLREMSFGDWEGRPWDEIHRHDRERLQAWGDRWWENAPPGGEPYAGLKRRVLAWHAELAAGEVVVAVAHGGSLRALLGALLGIPDDRIFELGQDYAHVSAVDLTPKGWEPRYLNQGRFAAP